jgi:RNA polymerase sigma factor (sigma-70 family)
MDTSLTLLERLCERSDPAWQDFCRLYEPLIRRWLRLDAHLRHEESALVQDVLVAVFQALPRFSRQHSGAFSAWLRQICCNRVKEFFRQRRLQPAALGGSAIQTQLTQLEDPRSELGQHLDCEHDRHLLHYLMERIRPEFAPTAWESFRRVVVEGEKPEQAAAALGLSLSAVYSHNYRVRKRLRQEAAGLLDSD